MNSNSNKKKLKSSWNWNQVETEIKLKLKSCWNWNQVECLLVTNFESTLTISICICPSIVSRVASFCILMVFCQILTSSDEMDLKAQNVAKKRLETRSGGYSHYLFLAYLKNPAQEALYFLCLKQHWPETRPYFVQKLPPSQFDHSLFQARVIQVSSLFLATSSHCSKSYSK